MRRIVQNAVICAVAIVAHGDFLNAQPADQTDWNLKNVVGLSDTLGLMTKDRIVVLKWEGGTPTGHFKFFQDGEPTKVDLKFIEENIKTLAAPNKWIANRTSGWIVIRVKTPMKNETAEEIDIGVSFDYSYSAGAEIRHGSLSKHWTGTIPSPRKNKRTYWGWWMEEPGEWKQTDSTYTTQNGREHELFSIRMSRPK